MVAERITVNGIDYVTLFVDDFEASLGFYTKVLGLTVLHGSPNFAQLSAGDGVKLGLHQSREEHRSPTKPKASRINLHFVVADVDAAHASLEAHGVAIAQLPTTQPWGMRTVSVKDPDGNIVELVTRVA